MSEMKKEDAYSQSSDVLAKRASGVLSKAMLALSIGALEQAMLVQFPACDSEPWDKMGLMVGDPAEMIRGVALALDPTPLAIEAAAQAGANVLITHHPPFLTPPQSFKPALSPALSTGAGVYKAIERGVSLMAFHTSLDVSVPAQRVLPRLLNLEFQKVVLPLAHAAKKGYGQLCLLGQGEALSLGQLAARCTSVFARPPRVWGEFNRSMKRVVTAAGAAGEVGRAALRMQADCLVCGEIKYHEALDLSLAGLSIIDLGHDTSELPLISVLAEAVGHSGVPDERVMVIDQRDSWAYPETHRV